MTKVLCLKQFLKKNFKLLLFSFRLIPLRSSCVNLICSSAVKISDFVSKSIVLVTTKWAGLQEYSSPSLTSTSFMSKPCWEASSLTFLLYDSGDNAIASADLWSFNTIDNYVAYASTEHLFELLRERDTVIVAYGNCCFFSDIKKLSLFSKLSDMFF